MNGVPIYNSRIFKNYIAYIRKYYPEINIAKILDYAEMASYQLEDEGHWFNQNQANRFHDILAQLTGDPNISHEVGRYSFSSEAAGAVRQYFLGFVTPAAAYALVEKLSVNVIRGHMWRTKNIDSQQIEVIVSQKPGVQETVNQCKNRIGTMEALAKLYTGKYAKVDHTSCIHRGDDSCIYHVCWEAPPSLIWKRIRNYAAILGMTISLSLPFLLQPLAAVTAIMFFLSTIWGLSYYIERSDKLMMEKNIESQRDTAGRLLDQINSSYNNALLVQEIGQATSSILDIDRLLTIIIEALEKRLDFDRGMIMLANRNKTRLIYTSGYGYSPEQRNFIENVEFHLDNPQSRGVFVITYRKQLPILVNDIGEIEKDLSPRSFEFAKKVGTRSFICVPIVFKGESLGVLVVDNLSSKRLLSQSDMSLLMGIAPQIAISINNAMAYRKITESEKRFRSLSESSPDIIYTIDTNGVLTYVNPAWQKILGYSNDEVVGKEFVNFVRKEEAPVYNTLLKNAVNEGGEIRDVIGTLLHKDGSDRFFSISGAPNIDSEGRMIGIVGTFKDVTDIMLSEAKLKQSFKKLQTALDSTIQAISLIVESRDPYTSGHQERVAQLATALATEMGLPADLIASIHMAAKLHDVGKINVPAEILSKPKRLTKIEMGMIQLHPEVGYNILKSIEFPYPVAKIVVQHHERLDGSGYPMGMIGENILLEARILAVADVVEAMASHRPYRPALGIKKTLEEISCNKGVLYDEQVVDACLKLFNEKIFAF